MDNKELQLLQELPENLSGSGIYLPTNENPQVFDVLSQHTVDPELFGDWEAIVKNLKENHVKEEEVELFGCVCDIVHIDLPPVGNFQGYKTDVLMFKSGIDFLLQNGGLYKSNLSDKFSNFLGSLSVYLKSYGIDLGENIINYADDTGNRQHNDILKYSVRFLPRYMFNFLLDGGKVLQVADGEGNYRIKNLDNIKFNVNRPLSLLSPDSQIMESIKYPIPLANYGGINMYKTNYSNGEEESQADKIMGMMDELKKADLVFIFRDNDKYSAMMSKIYQLIKYKYGGKVYCITIPKGTEKNQLTEQDKKALSEVLTNCKCMTDYTVSEWIGIETKKIEETLSDKELSLEQNEFLDTVRNIESYYMAKGIDTVYILSSYRSEEQGNFKLLLEHGGFCQKEDGTIYYIKTPHDQDVEHYNDAKRFWKNLFPHMHVEFIEENQLIMGKDQWINWQLESNYIFNYSKSEGALAIVDRHFEKACKYFENNGGSVITFGGDSIGRGISAGDLGGNLAEKICEGIRLK